MGLTKYRRKQNVDVLFPASLMIEDDIIFSFKRVNFGYETENHLHKKNSVFSELGCDDFTYDKWKILHSKYPFTRLWDATVGGGSCIAIL